MHKCRDKTHNKHNTNIHTQGSFGQTCTEAGRQAGRQEEKMPTDSVGGRHPARHKYTAIHT